MAYLDVLIDRNERDALTFPDQLIVPTLDRGTILYEVRRERVVLPAGDYALKGEQNYCAAETKRRVPELANNLVGKDCWRAADAWKRLVSLPRPILFLDMATGDFWRDHKNVRDPMDILHRVMGLVAGTHVQVLWFGRGTTTDNAHRSGEVLLRFMLEVRYARERALRRGTDCVRSRSSVATEEGRSS